jgi:hypothetical protein
VSDGLNTISVNKIKLTPTLSNIDAPNNMTGECFPISTDVQNMATINLCYKVSDLNEVDKKSVKDQCLLILSHRYPFSKSALKKLSSRNGIGKRFSTGTEFFNDQLQYLDLVYITDLDTALYCEKGDQPSKEDAQVVVVACALVNGYSDKNKESITIHYVATKHYYEGTGYASKLLLDILNNTQNKDKNRRIIFVVYMELFLPLLISLLSVMVCQTTGESQ